ncbi:MAG TPA: hypothetical protein VG454_00695, partial [Gemmatimonadales bacterium]|nr:hypothetical protein [Gemmatimonadales bacterium]
MTIRCKRALEALGEGRTLTTLQPHLETCAECRSLVETQAHLLNVRMPSLDSMVGIRIREAARTELAAAPRARPWWVEAVLLIFVTLGVGAAGALLMSRGNLAPPLRQSAVGAVLAASIIVGCWAALSPRRWGTVALVLALVSATAVLVGGTGLYPSAAGGFWEAGLRCARGRAVRATVVRGRPRRAAQ